MTTEATMETIGKEALAQVIEAIGIGGRDADKQAEELWPAFKRAVAGALAEIEEEEAEGVANWRDERHADKG